MLLVALKEIPGTIQIVAGQTFIEADDERRAQWIATGFARPAEMAAVAPPAPDRKGVPDWTGARVVVIASGPSLSLEQCECVGAWRAAVDDGSRRVIVINSSFVRAPFADIVYACDGSWWRARNGDTTNYNAVAAMFAPDKLWTQDVNAAAEFRLNLIRSAAGTGLSRKPGLIHQGMNSAYQCINLAYLAGARNLVLLGVDCHGKHWHADHPAPLSNRLPHAQWIAKFAALARDLKAEGVTVTNCSPGTALRAFPLAALEDVLA